MNPKFIFVATALTALACQPALSQTATFKIADVVRAEPSDSAATVANAAATQNAEKIKKIADANLYKENKEADAKRYNIEQEATAQQDRMEKHALKYGVDIIFDHINEVNFKDEDLKLIDDKAKKIITEFKNKLTNINTLNKETLEPIVNELIKKYETNFKGVGQPIRVALTGSKFGPGLYDIVISLGNEEVGRRLSSKIIA